jgi:Hsp20/alpha crystallin family
MALSPATLREEMDRLFEDFFTGWPMTSIGVAGSAPIHGAASRACSRRLSRPPMCSPCSRSRARRRRSTRRRAKTAASPNGGPEDADPGKIEAAFKKGVLTVTLPKRPETQAKRRKIDGKAA